MIDAPRASYAIRFRRPLLVALLVVSLLDLWSRERA
jgi:hypothetical protein